MNVAIRIQHKFFKANEEAMFNLAIETRKTLFSKIVLWSPGKHHLSRIKPLKCRVSLHLDFFLNCMMIKLLPWIRTYIITKTYKIYGYAGPIDIQTHLYCPFLSYLRHSFCQYLYKNSAAISVGF